MLLTAEPKGAPPPSDPSAPVVLETKDLKVWFPIKRGFFRKTVGHIKAVDGVDADGAARARRWAWWASRVPARPRWAWRSSASSARKGPSSTWASRIDGYNTAMMRPLRKEMQIVFQDPFGSLSPRLSIQQIVEEGLIVQGQTRSATTQRREIVAQGADRSGARSRHHGPLSA